MMLYILQIFKNQLPSLHPAMMNQDFIICSFGCFSPIGGYQLYILYNDAKNTHFWCKGSFWARINQKNRYWMILWKVISKLNTFLLCTKIVLLHFRDTTAPNKLSDYNQRCYIFYNFIKISYFVCIPQWWTKTS